MDLLYITHRGKVMAGGNPTLFDVFGPNKPYCFTSKRVHPATAELPTTATTFNYARSYDFNERSPSRPLLAMPTLGDMTPPK